jgi:hypothetical protein
MLPLEMCWMSQILMPRASGANRPEHLLDEPIIEYAKSLFP